MTKHLPEQGLTGLERTADMTDSEFDGLYDSAFEEQVSGKIVGDVAVDEDEELAEITEQEQISLDRRFEEAKKLVRPDLSDALLNAVSARTCFYLKLSVVVEDALSVLKLLRQEDIDCSAQLVLYGKALEQQLRDSFYSLFHRESELKNYEIPAVGKGMVSFGDVLVEDTNIGNYAYSVGDNAEHLSDLCISKSILYGAQEQQHLQWKQFWSDLKQQIHTARLIRNKADHAGKVSPDFTDVDRIADLCFGPGGNSIFDRCLVGRDLQIAIFGSGTLSLLEGKAMEGQEAVFTCTEVNNNQGRSGVLVNGGHLVKISPTKAKNYMKAHPEELVARGEHYRVRLLEFKEQDGALFFSAALLGQA